MKKHYQPDVLDMGTTTPLLCCPEDHRCTHGCKTAHTLCRSCELPVCLECQVCLQSTQVSPMGLINDNFIGFLDPRIYEADITWMEKTVATPYWTGMTLFSIDRRGSQRRPKHTLLDPLYAGTGRVLFRGQMFSAPMDWMGILEQLEKSGTETPLISLPVVGAVLAARVRVTIAAGLVDLNKLLRQATVRRNVVEQLIRMRKEGGHPDYQQVNMQEVKR